MWQVQVGRGRIGAEFYAQRLGFCEAALDFREKLGFRDYLGDAAFDFFQLFKGLSFDGRCNAHFGLRGLWE